MHPCNLWKSLCCCGGKDTSATIFRTQRICVNLCNLWEALLSKKVLWILCNLWENIRTLTSVDSVDSVGTPSRRRLR